ncbi:MAG: TIGR01777 family oxidoreductase [Fimbriimonadaceae bacterium]
MGKIVVFGGSGYLGSAVVRRALQDGHEAVVVGRSGHGVENARAVTWDAKALGPWAEELEGAYGVVNLCGSPIFQRWTASSKAAIWSSRVETTKLIGQAIAACKTPPGAWVNASATGGYGDCGTREVSEASAFSGGFLGELCQAWEGAVTQSETPNTSQCRLRLGIVLGNGCPFGSVLSKLPAIGPLGDGSHYQPWIHADDVSGLVMLALEQRLPGAMNATAPVPATNDALMASIRKAMVRLPAPPVPRMVIRLVCKANGWEEGLLMDSCRAVPQIATSRGYTFAYERVEAAALDAFGQVPEAWRRQLA